MREALKSPLLWLRIGLVAALGGVVALAFRVSWNALRDVALAIGADEEAATLYPFVVDGLMVVALVSSLYLTDRDRTFALCVLGGYTVASLALNYVHGLVPALHEPTGGLVRLAEEDVVHYALVFVASALPVGSIFFGSDLVAKVLHRRPSEDAPAVEVDTAPAPEPAAVPEPVPAEPRVPEVYPQPPEAVPAGVRLLPIVARPTPQRDEIRDEIPAPEPAPRAPVLAAEPPRTRTVVHAEYVPEEPEPAEPERLVEEPEAPRPPADPGPDWTDEQLAEHARQNLKSTSIRSLRAEYGIGQTRAERIQAALRDTPATANA